MRELRSLANETDAELFYSALFHLAQRAARNPSVAWAGALFLSLAEADGSFASIPPHLRARAREEAEVLQGGGSFGRRAEHFASHFFEEAASPSMILGMGVAGMAFSAARLGILARFASRPAAWWTRGLGARFLASSAALPAEVLAFWGTGRAVTAALHPEGLRWDRQSLGQELAAQFLTLGLLKLGGAASSALFDRFHGISTLRGQATRLPAFTGLSRQAFHQLGMFGGIAAGHYAETRLGLRPDHGHLWSDSLLTLFHFNVGGRIANTVLGPVHAARVREIEARTQSILRPTSPRSGSGIFPTQAYALSPGGQRLPIPEESNPNRPQILMMSSKRPGRGSSEGSGRPPAGSQAAPWHLEGACKTILRSLIDQELPIAQRYQMSQWLDSHMELARRTYEKLFQSDLNSGVGRPIASSWRSLDVLLHAINRQHFETLSDTLYEWHNRFRFLQNELREQADTGTQKQRRHVRRLMDSVDLKYLETRRYLNDAESYLGDDKGYGDGPRSKSVFAAENYPRLIQRFLDINSRLERYVQAKPELERLFKAYRPNPIERRFPEVPAEDVIATADAAGLSQVAQRRLGEALARRDFFLRGQDTVSLHRVLRIWSDDPALPAAGLGRRALERYLGLTEHLLAGLDPKQTRRWEIAHDEIAGERFATEDLRRKLAGILETSQENPQEAVGEYFEAARRLHNILLNHRPEPPVPTAPEWPELRAQLQRLRDRGVLRVETVNGLLQWFEPPETQRSSNVILSLRRDAVSGLIDFLRKGSHSEADRRTIASFLSEVVARRDRGMLGVLSIRFQNYQLGMMRDRLQIRRRPAADALSDQLAKEAYDQFLEAVRSTARFYSENRNVRGPFMELFLKLEQGSQDSNAQLAAPIVHAAQRLLDQGLQVELLGRGGSGEGIFLAQHPRGERLTVTVSSIREPLSSRAHMEHWLDRAERELLHNGDYQRLRNGKERLILVLQIPNIRSGVKRENLQVWARDYLETHPGLAEIELVIPEKGSTVVNPLDPTFFQVTQVRRESPTTENLIQARARSLENSESPWSDYAALIQMRREWAEHLMSDNADLQRSFRYPDAVAILESRLRSLQIGMNAAQASSPESSAQVALEAQALGPRIARGQALLDSARRIQRLYQDNWDLLSAANDRFIDDKGYRRVIRDMWAQRAASLEAWGWNDLTPAGNPQHGSEIPYPAFEERRALFQQASRMITGIEFPDHRFPRLLELSPAGYRVGNLHWKIREDNLALHGDLVPPGSLASAALAVEEASLEPATGTFSIGLSRDRRGTRHLQFSTLTLPPHLRRGGVGTLYFAELVRLANYLGIDTIESPDTSGDHRYTMAIWGMRFKSQEDRRKVVAPFEGWLHHHMKTPGLENFDVSSVGLIQTPRQLAIAHFDPSLKRLILQSWQPGGIGGDGPREIPESHQVGRLFLLGEARSYHGVLDLERNSYSMRTFGEYLRWRFPGWGTPEEQN